MTGRALIDTGALLAVANPRDQYHREAVHIGRRFLAAGGRWVGTPLVPAELHGHLLQRRGPTVARTHVEALLADPAYAWVEVGAELLHEAAERWMARFRDQPFSLTDAVSFEVMRRLRLEVAFTFDPHFQVAGYKRLN